MSIPINPYVLRAGITGGATVQRDGEVIKKFGDVRRASGYQEGRWDGERALARKIHKVINDTEDPVSTVGMIVELLEGSE